MRYSACKSAEDFDRLLGELMELEAAYERNDILSTPGINPDIEDEYAHHMQMCNECKI